MATTLTESQLKNILDETNTFFERFWENRSKSYKNIKLKDFKGNPFIINGLATAFNEKSNTKSIAKALVYPRTLGTSINTSFGTTFQKFMVTTLKTNLSITGSLASGMDIEYIDAIDGRKKYCQIKSGPQTINKDDITTISNHFIKLKNYAKTNSVQIDNTDTIVAILYGEHSEISSMYKSLENKGYTVLSGEEFWKRLTGKDGFYEKMVQIAQIAAKNTELKQSIEQAIDTVDTGIKNNPQMFGIDYPEKGLEHARKLNFFKNSTRGSNLI